MNTGNTAWVLISAALVAFMTVGLAFFYGGLVRSKNVLGMIMQNIFAMGLISTLWAIIGFSLVFGVTDNLWIGNFDFAFLYDVTDLDGDIPGMAFVAFQMMFAVITPALITGATADRLKFGSYALFIALWSLLVYVPVAKWVFNGWLLDLGWDGAKSPEARTRAPTRTARSTTRRRSPRLVSPAPPAGGRPRGRRAL